MEYRQVPHEVWSAFQLHPTLQRLLVSLGAAGLEGVMEARKMHTTPNYRRYEFLLLRGRMRRSVHVNLQGEAPGVMMACLWDFLANLPFPVIRNQRDWINIYNVEFNQVLERVVSLYYLQKMYLKAFLYLSRQARLLLVGVLFMVRQAVDTELRRGRLDLHQIDYHLKLTIFYYMKAMLWASDRSTRGRVCRVFINIIRNMWLLEPAFTMQVTEHEALTACVGRDQVAWQLVMTSRLQHYSWYPAARRWHLKKHNKVMDAKRYWNLDDVLPLDRPGLLGYLPYHALCRFFGCAPGGRKIPQPIFQRVRKYFCGEGF
ncbi:hypothetical protein E2C01_069649 [Portunus trituberculatus]|uniref:Uncharacterized protein n=1 Tax=Portunus trituberculatus TaxID=210409 RepID=A0A5B7I3D1_PORTR|nr:hypothetical protein [Portunus trituberculatus]